DELRGFYRSKVMIVLWIGLPLLSLFFFLFSPDTGEDLPLTVTTSLIVSSIAGTLGAVMLAVSIINEKRSKVYDLFLIRPIKRRDILVSKFLAVYVCIAIAVSISLMLGLGVDYYRFGGIPKGMLSSIIDSIIISLSMMAISASAGVLIGVISPSVLVGAVLVIYGGNQISILPALPALFEISNENIFAIAVGAVTTILLLSIAIWIFGRKQF
ncbi:MAG: ABC transporter permease, partial [Candidatus Natronoplasma sp.]